MCSSFIGSYKLHAVLWVNIPPNYKLYSSYNTEDYIAWAGLSLATTKTETVLFTRQSLIQSPRLLPKGEADKALYSPKVFAVVVWQKVDFQGACQADSNQSWEVCLKQKSAHIKHRGGKQG